MMSTFLFIFVVGTSTGGGTEITTSESSTLLYIVIGVLIPVALVCVVIATVTCVRLMKRYVRLVIIIFKIMSYKVTKK